MMRSICCVVMAGALVASLASREALAKPPRMKAAARRHFDRGTMHYQQREFDKAIQELKKGLRLDPCPEFFYALAQVFRASGDCAEAIRYYESFLGKDPPEQQAAAARRNIARCKQEAAPAERAAPVQEAAPAERGGPAQQRALAQEGSSPRQGASARQGTFPREGGTRRALAAPGVTEPPSTPVGESTSSDLRRPWYRNWPANGLAAGGVATLVAGVAVWKLGRNSIERARAATTYDDYVARAKDLSAADSMQKAGVSMMAAGGALVVAGALTYVLYRPAERRASVALNAGPGGALVLVQGRF
jgi:tetratricopeptide (TPR) repeat protein